MSQDVSSETVSFSDYELCEGRIVEIGFGLTKNIGNFQSVRADIRYRLVDGESYELAVDRLRTKLSQQMEMQPSYENLLDEISDKKRELANLARSCEESLDRFKKLDDLWQKISDEFRVNFPEISTLLSSYVKFASPALVDSVAAVESQVEARDCDWEDDDDDDDDGEYD